MTHGPPLDVSGWTLRHEWPVWRLVTEGVATLSEIESGWHMADVLDANDVLDVNAAARRSLKAPATPRPPR